MKIQFEEGEIFTYREFIRQAAREWVKHVLGSPGVDGKVYRASNLVGMDYANFRRLMRKLDLR
jgi:hypothetical protein